MKPRTFALVCVFGLMPGYNLFLYATDGYVYACGRAGCREVTEGLKLWSSLTFYSIIFLVFLGGVFHAFKLKRQRKGLSPP